MNRKPKKIPLQKESETRIKKSFLAIFSLIIMLMFSSCSNMSLAQSKGPIGESEYKILIIASVLMLIVILPVFVMAFWFSYKYRASKSDKSYQPDWASSKTIEWLIWSVPILIVVILSYITITKTYELDPYLPLEHPSEELKIEVVSLDWRWLFIYPEQGVASVNELVIPENTALSFRLTSSSVMTSFFIPQLGSQMYAMSGMQTRLHLMANEKGEFTGQNQEFSGKGYKNMHFKVKSVSEESFKKWINQAKNSSDTLNQNSFNQLSQPDTTRNVFYFSSVQNSLFDFILSKNTGWKGNMQMTGKNQSNMNQTQTEEKENE